MPEALAVLLVFTVSVFVYLFAFIRARDPANYRHDEELARIQTQRTFLEERLATASRENWSDEMKASLRTQLEVLARDVERAAARDDV